MGKDNREKGAEANIRTLYWIHRFGYITTQELAYLLQCDESYARKVLIRLRDQRYIQTSRLPGGTPAHTLLTRGARFLASEGPSEEIYRATYDTVRSISAPSWQHRRWCNRVAAGFMRERKHRRAAYTERDILTNNLIRVRNTPRSKIPDVLLDETPPEEEPGESMIWVEVERSKKKESDYKKLIDVAAIIAKPKRGELLSIGEVKSEGRWVDAFAESFAIAAETNIKQHARRLAGALRKRGVELTPDLMVIESSPAGVTTRPLEEVI